MNRRTLVLNAMAIPALQIPRFPASLGSIRESFVIDSAVQCQMIVTAPATDKLAEAWRQDWVGRAFENQGEWYLDSTEQRALPDALEALPGSLHYHTYTAGVAAQRGSMLVGTFRQDHIACVIRTRGDEESTLLALAGFFASRHVPEQWELLWNEVQLRSFIPTTDTFSLPVEPDDSMWF